MLTGCCRNGVPSIRSWTLNSDFRSTLRRLKPEKYSSPLARRADSDLEFLESVHDRPSRLLYDTTVYIDILQNHFPKDGELMMRAVDGWHSPVAESELAASCGLLNAAHPQTRAVIERIATVAERIPIHRMIAPDREAWREAGILSGMLARLAGYDKERRRGTLNDALIYASARRSGCAVLTRNIIDFDFLQQLEPAGRVLFYRVNRGLKARDLC
jgi:predicted nucleic acid-binding protein